MFDFIENTRGFAENPRKSRGVYMKTNNSNVSFDVVASGKRLKAIAKEKGLCNQEVADIVGYSQPTQITRVYSARYPLSDEGYEMLSAAWGLRVNYLKCIDDFPTENDMFELATKEEQEKIRAFQACREYLSTLGFEFVPRVSGYLTLTKIEELANETSLEEIFNDETIESIKAEQEKNLSAVLQEIKPIYVEWKKPPFPPEELEKGLQKEKISIDGIMKRPLADEMRSYSAGAIIELKIEKGDLHLEALTDTERADLELFQSGALPLIVEFDLFINGIYIAIIGINEFQELVGKFDGIASFSMNMLINELKERDHPFRRSREDKPPY